MRSILTLHTAAHARMTETKRFPSWTHPPNLRYKIWLCSQEFPLSLYIYIIFNVEYIQPIYIYIYIYIYVGGWGGESNWEIVSFRSCVRAQLYVRSEWSSNVIPIPFPFSLLAVRFLPFSFPPPPPPSAPQSFYPTLVDVIGMHHVYRFPVPGPLSWYG